MKNAFVFPGQGSQAVGMGFALSEAFPAARLVFEEVDDALEQKLSSLMFDGPEDKLILTENAQPALMATSIAVIRVLKDECGISLTETAKFVAGHSLGEYSALAAVDALALADAARLLKQRGMAMQEAVPVGEGAMAALLGLDLDAAQQVADLASEHGVCACANDNAPGQVVVSGSKQAVELAAEIATQKGARRAVMLPVSAPFHCSLMQPAADTMEEALNRTHIREPKVPIISNVTAAEVTNPDDIRTHLVEQVTAMVRWRESVLYMREKNVDTLIEIGSGKVLSGLARRISSDLTARAIQNPNDFDSFVKDV
ncbi:MAG: ACP S-malonyltransferase [Pseudomonadota bacterium]|nr:ACP S-malonyltransferase [Pseudomonadota bacterium]